MPRTLPANRPSAGANNAVFYDLDIGDGTTTTNVQCNVDIRIEDDFRIRANATFDINGRTITILGHLVVGGTITDGLGTGTIVFDGNGLGTISGTTTSITLPNLRIGSSGEGAPDTEVKTLRLAWGSAGTLTISGAAGNGDVDNFDVLDLNSTGGHTFEVQGVFDEAPAGIGQASSLTPGSGTFILDSATNQTVPYTTFYNLTVENSATYALVGNTAVTNDIVIQGTCTLDVDPDSDGLAPFYDLTITRNWTLASTATFQPRSGTARLTFDAVGHQNGGFSEGVQIDGARTVFTTFNNVRFINTEDPGVANGAHLNLLFTGDLAAPATYVIFAGAFDQSYVQDASPTGPPPAGTSIHAIVHAATNTSAITVTMSNPLQGDEVTSLPLATGDANDYDDANRGSGNALVNWERAYVWDGDFSANWGDDRNWQDGTAPVVGNPVGDVIIPDPADWPGPSKFVPVVNVTNAICRNLTIEASTDAVLVDNILVLGANGGADYDFEVLANITLEGANSYINKEATYAGSGAETFNNLSISKAAPAATVSAGDAATAGMRITVSDNLDIHYGTFDLGTGFTGASAHEVTNNPGAPAATVTISNGATLTLNTSRLNITGANGGITISSGGTLDLTSDPAPGNDPNTPDLDVAGFLTLSGGAPVGTINAAASSVTIEVGADWTDNGGTFTIGNSHVVLDGGTGEITGTGAPYEFNNLELAGGYTAQGNLDIGGNLRVRAQDAFTADDNVTARSHDVAGNVDLDAGSGSAGGWLQVRDDAVGGYGRLVWIRVRWSGYDTLNGETWPCMGSWR